MTITTDRDSSCYHYLSLPIIVINSFRLSTIISHHLPLTIMSDCSNTPWANIKHQLAINYQHSPNHPRSPNWFSRQFSPSIQHPTRRTPGGVPQRCSRPVTRTTHLASRSTGRDPVGNAPPARSAEPQFGNGTDHWSTYQLIGESMHQRIGAYVMITNNCYQTNKHKWLLSITISHNKYYSYQTGCQASITGMAGNVQHEDLDCWWLETTMISDHWGHPI